MSVLRRYRPLIDDWPAFEAACRSPLPACVVANRLRATPEILRRWLGRDGLDPRPVPFFPDAFLLPPDSRPAATLAHRLGLCWIQEAVATVPVLLLAPRPGERVLDLCAAPGNKTAQMVAAMADHGTIAAVDLVADRLGYVRKAGERLGHTSTCLVRADATSLVPDRWGTFDRVLVDVPCTCEGTSRKRPRILARRAGRPRSWRTTVQEALLEKAIRLCRVGGRIVYATCTYAPEENEGVIANVLERLPAGTVRLRPATLPGLRTAPGLNGWEGRSYPPALRRAWRIYPHLNDTGGFFVAVLEKRAALPRESATPEAARHEAATRDVGRAPDAFDSTMSDTAFRYLEQVYGIDRARLGGLSWQRHKRAALALVTAALRPPAVATHTAGVSALRTDGALPRLTTAGALRIGGLAIRNAVELHEGQIRPFFSREPQPIAVDQTLPLDRGAPTVVRADGVVLGLGRVTVGAGRLELRSTLPKRWYDPPRQP